MVACYLKPPRTNKRRRDPNTYIAGADPVRRSKYYAWLKHRAQANYRGESYSLTFEQWEDLWEDELWTHRGKSSESLCLAQIDCSRGWHVDNLTIMPRGEQVRLSHERRKNGV
jgi:hypothetical protein